jgi:hypothetical protein
MDKQTGRQTDGIRTLVIRYHFLVPRAVVDAAVQIDPRWPSIRSNAVLSMRSLGPNWKGVEPDAESTPPTINHYADLDDNPVIEEAFMLPRPIEPLHERSSPQNGASCEERPSFREAPRFQLRNLFTIQVSGLA